MARYLVLKMFRSAFPVGGMQKGFTAQEGSVVELKTEGPDGKPDPILTRMIEDGYLRLEMKPFEPKPLKTPDAPKPAPAKAPPPQRVPTRPDPWPDSARPSKESKS